MAFVADRVVETTQTTGTGTLDLDGASTGFRSFVSGIGDGNTAVYTIEDGVEWETGTGVVTSASPDTLSRVTVLASSNSGSKVNWTNDNANERNVFCAPLASIVHPHTTRGDIARGSSTGLVERLALGSAGQVMESDGTDLVWGAGLPRGYLAGLTLSNDTDATNDINVTAGAARNADNDGNLVLASEQTKQIDVSWATGDDAGGLSSSLTLTNDTWYHVFLILVSGTVEAGFDTSVTAANLVTDHSATKYRRIGSVRYGTATNLGFSQLGDEFRLDDPPLDVNLSQSSSSALRTLTVPVDVKVLAIMNAMFDAASAGNAAYISSPDVNDEAASSTAGPLANVGGDDVPTEVSTRTNTSSQVRTVATETRTLKIATLGWVDRRGRG